MKVFAMVLVVIPLISAENALNYARLLSENELPNGKNTYYRGKAIEHPEQFVERKYLAHQFHGQDGLGRAKFGYSDWNQARYENIDIGKTEGAYQYVDPNGEHIKVNYYADDEGFHQTDNRQQLQTNTDTPEVMAGIADHQRAWRKAATANLAYDGRYGGQSNIGQHAGNSWENNGQYGNNEGFHQIDSRQAQANYYTPEAEPGRAAHERAWRIAATANGAYDGRYGGQSNIAQYTGNSWENDGQYGGRYRRNEDQANGQPRGFFYEFDYEVPVVARKDERER